MAFQSPGIVQFFDCTARPEPVPEQPFVSVVIAARNESGNIKSLFERTPKMGGKTEIVFVEGHSKDDTYAAIEREMAAHPSIPSQLFRQTGIGKADAIRLGFEKARGDVLMILDADMTVPPEDLPRFYEALVSGKGEFINGVRLVYPMEKEAMRTMNLFGNKFFSMAFSWLLGQPIKDTLCGTKVLWNKDYELIAANRSYFGDFDPFGDYDLIFGAAKLNLKIIRPPHSLSRAHLRHDQHLALETWPAVVGHGLFCGAAYQVYLKIIAETHTTPAVWCRGSAGEESFINLRAFRVSAVYI